jgi:hypothetical protein
MIRSWQKFILVDVPIAMVALALTAQALAFALSNVPMWRDRADELALAATSDPTNYRIILLGDSKTNRATARFLLGAPGQVANLTTHAYVGFSGSLFLLERYLSAHPAPQHVVLAFAPLLYRFENNIRLSRYHLWHTFNRPAERSFLRANHPGMGRRDSLPAVLDLQERVVEPLLSWFRLRYATLRGRKVLSFANGYLNPSPDADVELSNQVGPETDDEERPDGQEIAMAPVNAAVLARLCNLSNERGFAVDIVWPPVPNDLVGHLNAAIALSALEMKIRSSMRGRCDFGGFTDFNKIREYSRSSFHHDLLHLFGDGWEQRYASDLRDYLSGLLHRVPHEAKK